MRDKFRVAFLRTCRQIGRQCRATGGARDLLRSPADYLREECPGVRQRRPVVINRQQRTHPFAVGARLFRRVQPVASEDSRGEDEADRLDIADPFVVGVGRRHA
jgi:hypothetical protein